MALNWQTQDISVAGGLETKTDAKLVQAPKTTTAENVVYTTNGTVKKRNGYTGLATAITGGGSITTASGGATVGSAALVVDSGKGVYTYSPTAVAWTNRGTDVLPAITSVPVLVNPNKFPYDIPFGSVSYADIGNYRVIAAETNAGGSIVVGLWDVDTGVWLTPPVAASATSSARPTVIAFGRFFYLFYASGFTAEFQIYDSATFAASGLVLTGPTTLAGITDYVDACINPAGTVLYAYGKLTAATGRIHRFSTAGSATNVTTAVNNLGGQVSIAVNSTYVLLASATKAEVYDVATMTEGAAITHGLGDGTSTLTDALSTSGATTYAMLGATSKVAAGVQQSGFMTATVTAPRTLTAGTATVYPWPNGPCNNWPMSRPVWTGTKFAMWLLAVGQVSQTLQPTLYLGIFTPGTAGLVMARAAYDQGVVPNTLVTLPQPDAANFTMLASPLKVLTIIKIDNSPARAVVPLANGALITGSRPLYYDGVSATVCGFDGYPEMPTGLAGAAGGAMTASTTYFYTIVYRDYDNYGNLLYSSPGPVQSVTLTAGQNSVVITPTAGTAWPTRAFVLYRTTAADTLNFREIPLASTPTGVAAYTDTLSDATLAAGGKAFLYANPVNGEVQNDPPPACSVAVAGQQRVFLISSEYPTRVYYSKPFNPGRGPEFSALQYLSIDPASGPCTALGILDDSLVIFKARSIYLLAGVGPDATGSGSFNIVSRVATDDGCTVPASVVSTADGLYFQGNRGLNMVDRTYSISYVGAPVEGTLAGRTVTAALYIQKQNQARFYLDNGTVAVLDTFLKRWSTFVNYAATVGAFIYNGAPAHLTSAAVVNVENAGYTDNGAAITMTLETGWIPVAEGQQGWGRLRRVLVLGTYYSVHTATLSFGYDYLPYSDTVQFSSAAGALTSVEQWRTRTKRQVMQAVRLKLVDTSTTANSYDIVGLALEMASKSGPAKLPTAQSV